MLSLLNQRFILGRTITRLHFCTAIFIPVLGTLSGTSQVLCCTLRVSYERAPAHRKTRCAWAEQNPGTAFVPKHRM